MASLRSSEGTNQQPNDDRCVLCSKVFTHEYIGRNNAHPLTEGECCDECNLSKVIPARAKTTKMEVKQTPITKQEFLTTLTEVLGILKGKTPVDEEFIGLVATKGYITAFVCDDDKEFLSDIVANVMEDACSTFLQAVIGKKEPDVPIVMIRATEDLKINQLLANRINNKINHTFELNEEQTKKYIGRLKKRMETGSSKQCVMCCKKGLKKCPCGKERYCSSECQKKDWKLHKHIHTK